MKVLKNCLSFTAATIALAAAQSAAAQDAKPSTDDASGAEIVVTAQKRTERLLDVPVAVSAISADALASQNTVRLVDFYEKVPGLQFAGQRTSNLSLRGITTASNTGQTVAILVDDVQFGGTTGAGQPPIPDFDASALERIEVLRGPQGTLYGAASLGGLIKYVLRSPSTERLSGNLEATGVALSHGDFGYALRGSLNIPITDRIAVAGSGFYREDAPYLDNASTSPLVTDRKDVNKRTAWGFRGALLVRPTDNLTVTLSALNQTIEATNSDLAGGVPICTLCYPLPGSPTPLTAPITFKPVYGDLTLNSLDSSNDMKFQLYSGRVELDLGGAQVTSITAWSRVHNVINSDVSNIFRRFLFPAYGLTSGAIQLSNGDQTHKFSQELRVGGQSDVFDWLVGGYYTVEKAAVSQALVANDGSGSSVGTPFLASTPSTYREYAGFAALTWHATDKLDLQVGGRYAHNTQKNSSDTVIDAPAAFFFGPSSSTTFDSSDDAFTWMASASYHIDPDNMLYARVATGYRPGGPNLDATGVPAFDPDRVVNYELGFKGKVIPGLLTIDTAIFQIDWSKIQLTATSANALGFSANGNDARSRGLEFAATLTPWAGMSVDGNIALTDADLRDDLPVLAGSTSSLAGARGDRLPFSSKVSGNISALQRFPVKDGVEASVGITYSYVGNRAAGFNTIDGNTSGRPRPIIPAYSTVGLNASVTFDDAWSITAFVRNLFDKRGFAAVSTRSGTGVPTALYIQPTTMGITVGRKF